MAVLPDNSDLAWDLDDFSEAQRAKDFVMQFEQTMCVYSPSVGQIYTNYNMYFPEDWDRKLVILPDAAAFHDTFFHIENDAVSATGLYVIPGELIDRTGLFLTNMDANKQLGKKQIPFEPGMRAIIKKRPPQDPFLPVLAKGDLRELEHSWPVMHLHRVKPSHITNMSNLDRSGLTSVINEKLESLFIAQRDSNAA